MCKKLLFVVDNLVMGGVTRVLLNLLNNLDYDKYDVDLLVLHYYEDVEINIPSQVTLIKGDSTYKYIDKTLGDIIRTKDISAFLGKLKLVFSLKSGKIKKDIARSRKKILSKKYDTEISFNDGFTQIFVANGDSERKISWLHADISVFNDSSRYTGLIGESLAKMDAFICVSKMVKDAYTAQFGIKNAYVIHNIIDSDKILQDSQESIDFTYPENCIKLISVGRLCEAKNYARFIRVHKMLLDDGYNVASYIIGDGLDRELLEQEIEKNQVGNTFTLLGRKENPFPYVKNADVFVLSSNHEGLPTVLYEALVLGVPCVSTKVAGAEEIIGEQYGIITEKSDRALFDGIKELLQEDRLLSAKSASQAYRFSISEIIAQIEKVL